MSAPRGRGLVMTVLKNFRDSFNVIKGGSSFVGTRNARLVGEDPFGNKYYEIPANPRLGKRKAERWYQAPETSKKDVVGVDLFAGFDSQMPAEWESWLRFRRDEPPSQDQVEHSLALADMKKRNAAKLEEARIEQLKAEGRYEGPPKPQDHEKPFYPKYDEYEVMPGEHEFSKKDKWADFKNPYAENDKGSSR